MNGLLVYREVNGLLVHGEVNGFLVHWEVNGLLVQWEVNGLLVHGEVNGLSVHGEVNGLLIHFELNVVCGVCALEGERDVWWVGTRRMVNIPGSVHGECVRGFRWLVVGVLRPCNI